jgi:hypothetical protein
MENQNFNAVFLFDQSAKEVFDAVTNVRGWWSEMVEGGTHNLNDEFIYRYADLHYSKQKLTEVTSDKKVVWLVTDSNLTFVDNKNEWTGTQVVFEITEKAGQTQLSFTHVGLSPQVECYKACSGGWTFYLQSLCALITTGKGSPDLKGEEEVKYS